MTDVLALGMQPPTGVQRLRFVAELLKPSEDASFLHHCTLTGATRRRQRCTFGNVRFGSKRGHVRPHLYRAQTALAMTSSDTGHCRGP